MGESLAVEVDKLQEATPDDSADLELAHTDDERQEDIDAHVAVADMKGHVENGPIRDAAAPARCCCAAGRPWRRSSFGLEEQHC